MTPQERDVIAGIFDRLRQAANQPRDPEAENFIAERLREQPYAVYAMAQSIYVQEQALANLQAQAQQLQAEVEELRRQPAAAPAPAQSGGFLSGIFGGGASQPARNGSVPSFPQRAAPQPASPVPASPPWGAQPGQQGMAAAPAPGPWQSQQAQQPARGGFMASALTTAAGVAGGMVAGNMLMNAFGGGKPAASEAKPAEANATQQNDTATAENAQPASNQSYEDPGHSYQEPSYQNASNEGYDDGSSGFGDDEWA
ncbi:DUF2076 domain-containing protein [Bosea rubneri]|uniref:DUF2076 domain-containing protein n=1 Tax=Bosea rubneri TaxID=3075434 RepID=A0ABU3S517_9HYPH|nr:DUF2076 domain-containing protein [Bosea sp. ZW T0_25]MDU0339465.1 DUF2076 domain-containing protein [Bosea sp. ZW T0_25]